MVHVDLVGNQKQKAASSVKHKILFCHWMHTQTILVDLIKCYGFAGKTSSFQLAVNLSLFLCRSFSCPVSTSNAA